MKEFADDKLNVTNKIKFVFHWVGNIVLKGENTYYEQFLAPLAEGQRAIVMALCLSCVRPSMSVYVHTCVHASVRKLFLQKTSPQKLLTGFLRNFTGMFLRWSSFKFLQIIVFYEEFMLPWQSK